MPRFYPATEAEFADFEAKLFERKFRRITREEVVAGLRGVVVSYGQQKMFPRRERGFENGYILTRNGLEVVVWTSWLEEASGLRNMDRGWVLIREEINPEKVLYFAVPRNRTKNFLSNLFEDARIAAWRIRHRPKCPACGEFMQIVQRHKKDGSIIPRARFWRCERISFHPDGKVRNERWDCMFTDEQKAPLVKRRKQSAKARATRVAEGKQPFAALKKQQVAARKRRLFGL